MYFKGAISENEAENMQNKCGADERVTDFFETESPLHTNNIVHFFHSDKRGYSSLLVKCFVYILFYFLC